MRSRNRNTISSSEVHQWALSWLINSTQLKDQGPKCTATVVWNIVLRAAARTMSVFAACRDLANAPCDTSVMGALGAGLPKTLPVLEKRLNAALADHLPRCLQRRAWTVAIDWHLVPYYGEPKRSRNEIYYGKPRQGTTKFHAYATACIVSHGVRYTLAATWVRRHETTVKALSRLRATISEKGLKIQRLLLDRAFFNVLVVQFLQEQEIPFLMPVMFRGRIPKKRRKLKGLHWIRRQKVGCYSHTLRSKKQAVTVSVSVAYRTHKNRKDRKHKQQKLLFAAWRVSGSPQEIRELYRTRFGIETSYRQARQARIYTCTRDPHLRLLFVVVALLLRNVWVWIHETMLAEGHGDSMTLHQEKLRLRRMLEWIALEVAAQLHDGSTPYVDLDS
jgi:Transposase DDE domain